MNELIEIDNKSEFPITPQTLQQRRNDLRLRLQLNRRLLAQKLLQKGDEHFPRSVTMRFLSSQSTRHVIQRVAGAALGIQAFRSLRYGYSLIQFARSAYSAFKATLNVVKAKEGV
jgi:hypothetical protein